MTAPRLFCPGPLAAGDFQLPDAAAHHAARVLRLSAGDPLVLFDGTGELVYRGPKLVRECVERVNADLAQEPEIANSQIHRFLILHKELDADDEELTRTRKVRRGAIAEKYGVLVDALYGGKSEQFIETAVKFEDGRSGVVSATLKIVDARVFPAVKRAA